MEEVLPLFMQSKVVASDNFLNFANNEPCILGIDEAGRGPALGPMVYACAITPLTELANLTNLGIDDSKKLKAEKRNSIYDQIQKNKSIAYAYVAHSARYITAHMFSVKQPLNLNIISHNSAISLIQRALDSGINIQEINVDTVGPKESYQEFLQSKFPGIRIIVEEKADSLFKIVGAASIVAKVNRDHLLENHDFDENGMLRPLGGFGAGYSDPDTMRYLTEGFDPVFGYSTLVRFSWKNIAKAVDEGTVKCKWIEPNAPQTLFSFFQKLDTEPDIKKCSFFKDKNIKHALTF